MDAHTGLAADLVEQAVEATPWHPTQVFVVALQKLFEASLQSVSPLHSTHVPAPAPLAIHTGLAEDLVEQAVAVTPWHPTQVLVVGLQKLFNGSLQSGSPLHSTQVPAPIPLAIQTGLVADLVEQAEAATPWHPTQVLVVVLQKLLEGSFVQ